MSAGAPLTRRQMREIAEREERQRAAQAEAQERASRTQAQAPDGPTPARQPAAPQGAAPSHHVPGRGAHGAGSPPMRQRAQQAAPQRPAPQAPAAQRSVPRPAAGPAPAAQRQAPVPAPAQPQGRATAQHPARPGSHPGGGHVPSITDARPAPGPVPTGASQPQHGASLPQRAPAQVGRPADAGAARRAAMQVPDVEPAPRSRPAPTVVPPAVTGAVRTVDHTGRITPVVPVDQAGRPAAYSAPPRGAQPAAQAPARMGVRDAVAQASVGAPSPVNPSGGVTPQSAAPVQQQRTSLASAPSAPSAWGPIEDRAHSAPGAYAPFAPTAAAQPGAFTSQPPHVGTHATTGQPMPWGPVTGAGTPAAAPQAAPSFAPAVGGPNAAVAAGGPSGPVGGPGALGEDAPIVPAWGQVLGAPTVDEPDDALDDAPANEQDAVLGLSWPQIIILVAVGLLLGVLVWLLLESRTPDGSAQASADVATVTVDARAPGEL